MRVLPDVPQERVLGAGRHDTLARVALVLSAIVGPVGAILGAMALRRAARTGQGSRRIASAAIVLGVLQTIVVLLLVWPGTGPNDPPLPSTTGSSSSETSTSGETSPSGETSGPSPSTDTPSTSTTSPSAEESPTGGPAPEELDPILPPNVAGFVADGFVEDPGAMASGAESAYTGSYSSGDEELQMSASVWGSPGLAAEYLAAEADAAFTSEEMLDAGAVGDPSVGEYRYFESHGVATIFWNIGPYAARVSGDPYRVQEFFVQFPK